MVGDRRSREPVERQFRQLSWAYPACLGGRATGLLDHARCTRPIDHHPVQHPYGVPVHRPLLRAERAWVVVVGDPEEAEDPALLPGLLDQLPQQAGGGLLTEARPATAHAPGTV